jgi:hypothetical protein
MARTKNMHTDLQIYFVMIMLFVIYLSYLNIGNLLQIKFAKKFAELVALRFECKKLTQKNMLW